MKTFRPAAAGAAATLALLLAATAANAQMGGMRGGGPQAGGPQAEGESPTHGRRMRIVDTDSDGKVTMAEIEAEQKRLITAADVDGDGSLSADEFRRRGRWFQRLSVTTLFDLLDANGDGKLTAAEIAAPSARWFKRYDANNDGGLDAGELPAPHWRGRHHGHRR